MIFFNRKENISKNFNIPQEFLRLKNFHEFKYGYIQIKRKRNELGKDVDYDFYDNELVLCLKPNFWNDYEFRYIYKWENEILNIRLELIKSDEKQVFLIKDKELLEFKKIPIKENVKDVYKYIDKKMKEYSKYAKKHNT